MRIACPHCGERDGAEFVYRGDAAPQRPADDAGEAAFADYVYLRDNPAGSLSEYWYHASGCRRWLIVTRDTRTHAISDVAFAHERGA
jgi:heterotetrameric sarcosine oxidase delta subunit